MSTGGLGCDDFEALAPEVALGTLRGSERAEALARLASCADCQRRVAELADVVDAMVLLAPGGGAVAGPRGRRPGADGGRRDME